MTPSGSSGIVESMQIRIRDGIRGDADAIAAAHIASWRAAYTHIFPPSVFDSPDFDQSRIEMWRTWTHSPTPDRRLIVATADERVVGFAYTGRCDDPGRHRETECGELFGFYAHPDVWGTDVATLMMDSALSSLRQLGVDRAIVWTLTDAHRARTFYEKSGWSLTGSTATWAWYPDSPAAGVQLGHPLD
jgi:GNAT superfamily N-acetyltransferase